MPPSHYDPRIHRRRSIRLRGYDYSQAGAYFVTIVTHGRACLFGEIVDGEMTLNRLGQIVRWEWLDLPKRFPYLDLGAFVIMPNHFHAILIFLESIRACTGDPLGQIDMQSADAPLQTTDLVRPDGSPLRFGGDMHTGDPLGQIDVQSADAPLRTTDLVRPDGSPLRFGGDMHTGSPAGQIDMQSADAPLRTTDLVRPDGSPLRFGGDMRTGDPLGQINVQSADAPLQTTNLVRPGGSPLRLPGADAMPRGPQPGSLGAIMAQFKSRVTKRLWKIPSLNSNPVWQRNYYEHIIRNEDEMAHIWRYIESNPSRWTGDRENPHRRSGGG